MPTRTDNTFQEELTKLLTSIAQMKVLPDASLEFLAVLETMVLQQLRSPIDAMQQQGLTNAPSSLAAGAAPAPGGMPTIPPGAGMQMQHAPAGQGAGVPGVPSMVGGGMPNPDELRRMLGSGGQGQ